MPRSLRSLFSSWGERMRAIPRHCPPCARVDSNHPGENFPQGPQPYSATLVESATVQIVLFASFQGRIGHIGRPDFCQAFVTAETLDESIA
jgi:hypothetical protein